MTNPPFVISVAAGTAQHPLLEAAQQLNYRTIVIDRDPQAPGFASADVRINQSTLDIENTIAALRELSGRYEYAGVLARTTGVALYTAVAIAEDFGLRGLTKELVRISTEKSALRGFCEVVGLPMPRGYVLAREENPPPKCVFPVVVKPDLPLVGKKAVSLANSPADLAEKVDLARSNSVNHQAEVEEFIEGIDVGCLFWARNGKAQIIAWWDELVGFGQQQQAMGLGASVPSVIRGTPVEERAQALIEKLTSFFPGANCLLIASLRLSRSHHIHIIELHADLGGDKIAEVLFASAKSDFNFFELAVCVATGTASSRPEIEFTPTIMFYPLPCKVHDEIPGLEVHSDYALAKTGSIKSNLLLLPEVNRLCNRSLILQPDHVSWVTR